ncbi:2-oxoacid:acceptor oxidoreductase family protein [Ideonella sp. A 288]|uniref:2-oxoacid:acceptor oxidoreductase family protein n=1 Tax=Ideonella sp. A 288 TaxID=1962181 RepID=UPI000B4B33EA|nr:2-oxoacid:acceptor oxidoreductase family protein [Ideonella sp. A 288]
MSGTLRMELRIAGTGGQGLILASKMLAQALVAGGRGVAQSQTYEPTSRGGYCNADLVVGEPDLDYPLTTALDALVLLDQLAVDPSWHLLRPGALVLADTRLCPELPAGDCRALHLPMTRTAIELGSERVANIVALGALVALGGACDRELLARSVRAETPRLYIDLNMDALAAGFSLADAATRH